MKRITRNEIKYCYKHEKAIKDALINGGCIKELKKFETFIQLVKGGYIDMNTMKRDYRPFFELDEDSMRYQINLKFNEIEDLNFKKLAKMIK